MGQHGVSGVKKNDICIYIYIYTTVWGPWCVFMLVCQGQRTVGPSVECWFWGVLEGEHLIKAMLSFCMVRSGMTGVCIPFLCTFTTDIEFSDVAACENGTILEQTWAAALAPDHPFGVAVKAPGRPRPAWETRGDPKGSLGGPIRNLRTLCAAMWRGRE